MEWAWRCMQARSASRRCSHFCRKRFQEKKWKRAINITGNASLPHAYTWVEYCRIFLENQDQLGFFYNWWMRFLLCPQRLSGLHTEALFNGTWWYIFSAYVMLADVYGHKKTCPWFAFSIQELSSLGQVQKGSGFTLQVSSFSFRWGRRQSPADRHRHHHRRLPHHRHRHHRRAARSINWYVYR